MTRPTIKIHDCSTNEVIVREMNDEEYAQHQTDVAVAEANIAAKAEAQANKAAAQAKLLALGLTEADLIAMGLMPKPVEPIEPE
jgi:hypothetical protein